MNSQNQPTIAARRERLKLECELDRLNLRIALRPASERPVGAAVSLIPRLLSLVPGRWGRWTLRALDALVLVRGAF